MNFKRFLVLAVFLIAPGMAFAGGTITYFNITSNVHPMEAPGANLEVWFGVDGYEGWNKYQVQSISYLIEFTESGCLDVEPDITTPGQYKATGFTDNNGPGFDHLNTLKPYKAYPDDGCGNPIFDDNDYLFTFSNWENTDYHDDYLECFIFLDVQETNSSGASGKSRLQVPDGEECSDLTTFRVEKFFTDGNDETEITLDFWCNNGTFSPQSITVTPDNGLIPEQTFIVENLDVDDDTICTVTERPVDGYDTSYLCRRSQATRGEDCVTWDKDHLNDATDCNWSNVWPGQENTCLIENSPTPVDVSVTKVWDVTNIGGDFFDTTARLTINCDFNDGGEIIEPNVNGLLILPAAYKDGEYTLTVEVIPEWHSTAIPPALQEYTECWASEEIAINDSAVEAKSTCGDDEHPGMDIAVGMGDSCVITNTVFFEGIPTLNQYGMAIMALLMLGMGFVGFRRLV